jgi:hypothetical protein
LNNLNSLKNSLNAISKNRILSAVIISLFLASVVVAAVPVKAQEVSHGGNPYGPNWSYKAIPSGVTPDLTVTSLPFLSMSPNPIGLNQQLLVNMWLTFPSAENRFCADYSVNIVKPDGSTDQRTLQSYVADGTSYFIYNVDQVGTWQFKFSFPGEYFPAGYYYQGLWFGNVTGQPPVYSNSSMTYYPTTEWYTPVSTSWQNLTVQSNYVISWSSALPTDYWTRPIMPNNREWYTIAGNYPWSEQQFGGAWSVPDEYYGPFISAPNSAHILWFQTTTVAGLIGGEAGQYSTLTGATGMPNVIYQGRAYATVTKSINGLPAQSFAECFDIQTGKIYYDIATANGGVTPTHINYINPVATVVPGEAADATYTVELNTLTTVSNILTLYKVNPTTGAVTNISLGVRMSNPEMMYSDGYYLSYNVTGTANTANEKGTLYNWTSSGPSTSFAARTVTTVNVTIPHSLRAGSVSDLYGLLGDYDPVAGITVIQSRFIYGDVYGFNLVAVNLNTGAIMWNYTSPSSDMVSAYRPTNGWARDGLYIAQMERGYLEAWNIRTGAVVWKSTYEDYPWGEFWMYDRAAYQDLLLSPGYSGLWAFNETTGAVVWHYADPAIPFETPYSSNGTAEYSVQDIRVIDGKVFLTDNEHTPSQPATRGWGLMCINVTTGQLMWKLYGSPITAGACSDGYLFGNSGYSGQMYIFGKGQSTTTVSAPQAGIVAGAPVTITGTVLDQSAAQPNTPAISDASMATWMDYLHFQLPVDGIYHNITVTGVPVTIYVTDPNGNTNVAGTATSDASGTFGLTWTPTLAGDYKITAAFGGSASYGSSYDSTYATVVNAPATATPAPTASQTGLATTTDVMTYIVIGVVAIIIAIAIATVLILRKH